jgi:hypothetical protein
MSFMASLPLKASARRRKKQSSFSAVESIRISWMEAQ